MKQFVFILVIQALLSCHNPTTAPVDNNASLQAKDSIGAILKFDKALDEIIAADAKIEIIADGLDWSEGPLWVPEQNMLLFSDVPANTIYKWTAANGKALYLNPSGFTGTDNASFREPGSNGLLLDENGNLVLCQHGDRRLAKMNAPLDNPAPNFTVLADHFENKKFNSPNDCVLSSTGEYYFTDPPYGLKLMDDDPLKETTWNGVYKRKTDGTILLLSDSITKPNGIALFPGEKKLLVANSDPQKPLWYIWDINGDKLTNGKVFFDPRPLDSAWRGLPDGLKIDSRGNVIASGPGGVYFLNSAGTKLGMIRLQNPASNIAITPDERTIFITNDMYVLRVEMKR